MSLCCGDRSCGLSARVALNVGRYFEGCSPYGPKPEACPGVPTQLETCPGMWPTTTSRVWSWGVLEFQFHPLLDSCLTELISALVHKLWPILILYYFF